MMLNGLSQLVYSMYMIKPEAGPQAAQARARVEAKQAATEARRQERDELRRLTRSEREAKLREIRMAAEADAAGKKRLAKLEKERERAARAALLDPTIQLTEEEIALIADGAPQNSIAKTPVIPAPAAPEAPPEKQDIIDILDQKVEVPEPFSVTPLELEDLFNGDDLRVARPTAAPAKPERATEEFSWTWPPKSD
jgi:hypothetical protein